MGVEVVALGWMILALDSVALIKVFGSGVSSGNKLLWTLVVLLAPVIGLLIWMFAGPKSDITAARV